MFSDLFAHHQEVLQQLVYFCAYYVSWQPCYLPADIIRTKIPIALYTVPSDDEQISVGKNVEAINQNKLKVNGASCWSYYIIIIIIIIIIITGSVAQRGLWPPRFTRFLDHTQGRATVGRTPLDE
jgi:hypothetical protein